MRELVRKGLSLMDEYKVINAGTYASSIAYFAFLSLVPALALCISLVSLAGIGQQEVVAFFSALVPEALGGLVESLVSDAFSRSGIAFSLSTITLLWSASKGIKALRAGLNAAFAEEETRSEPVVAIISILAIVILGALVAALIYLMFSHNLLRFIARFAPDWQLPEELEYMINPLVMLVASVFILCLCYAYLPAGRRRFSTQLPGSVAASIACAILSFGFRVYVDVIGNYTVLYGSIATVAMLLFWMYLISYALITCGFLNRMFMEGKLPIRKEEED